MNTMKKQKKNKTKKDHGYESIIMGGKYIYIIIMCCSAVDSLRLSIYFLPCTLNGIYMYIYLYYAGILSIYV